MAIKAGRVGVNPESVDELGNITGGGLTPEERAKLEKTLVTPVTAPTEKEFVGVGTSNEQIMFKVGDGLFIDGAKSPFTLKASGGLSVFTGVRNGLYSDGSCYAVDFGTHILICGNVRNNSAFGSGSKLAYTFNDFNFPVVTNAYCDTGNGTKPIIVNTNTNTINLTVSDSNDVSFFSFSFIVSKT